MILEHAVLQVTPGQESAFEAAFAEAEPIISGMPGFRSLRLSGCVEDASRYLLLVEWERLEDHTVGFRTSPEYQRWKALLHDFYDPFPEVDHFEQIATPRSTNRVDALPWSGFVHARLDLATATRDLLYQFGVGLAFLATVREDGGPRVHPMCPLVVDDRLVAFIVPSPKRRDLMRDGRYALHSFPSDDNEDAVYLTGRARSLDDAPARGSAAAVYLQERDLDGPPPGFENHQPFELLISSCLLTRTTGHGDPAPNHTIWKAT